MEESVTALDFAPFSAEQYDFLPFFFFFFLTKVNSSLCLFSKSYLLAIGLENGAIQLLKVAKKDYSTEPFSTIPKWYFFIVASLLFASLFAAATTHPTLSLLPQDAPLCNSEEAHLEEIREQHPPASELRA